MRVQTLIVVVGGLLAFTAVASATPETTTPPGQPYTVSVELTDHGAILNYLSLPRGLKAQFNVINTGKKPHSFKIFNHSTRQLKNGGRAVLTVVLLHRGNFPWQERFAKSTKNFHGIFTVF